MIIEREEVRCQVRVDSLLGEGPVWVAREAALYWVDIKRSRIYRWAHATEELSQWQAPFQVGSLAPVAGGGFIAGTVRGFAFVDPSADRYDVIIRPNSEPAGNRFNDGKLDRRGRFWAGTMDDSEQQATGALYLFRPADQPLLIDSGYRVTNGPTFDREGRRMYHSDSARQTIFEFDMNDDGGVGAKRVFAQFEGGDGYPDGMTVDCENCLWVAFWDGWCVRRFSPDGAQIAEVRLPVARPTSCAFGGPRLETLFITSARANLSDEQLDRQPLAGSLFAFEPAVQGIADTLFERKDLPA